MSRKKKQQAEAEAEVAATAPATGGFGDAGPPPPPASRITPIDIQQKVFRSSVRGYQEREVDQFLDEVTEELARLLAESRSLREQLERAEMRPTARFGSETEGAAAIEDARVQATRTLAEAREEGAGIVAEARSEAIAIIEAAEAQAGTGRPPGWGAAAAGATVGAAAGASARMPDRDFIHREREFLQALASLIQDHAEAIREDLRRVRGEPEAGAADDMEAGPPGKHAAAPPAVAAVAEAAQAEPERTVPSDPAEPEENATPVPAAADVAAAAVVAAQVAPPEAHGMQGVESDSGAPQSTVPDGGPGEIQDEPAVALGSHAEPQPEPDAAVEAADHDATLSDDAGAGVPLGDAPMAATHDDEAATDASMELADIAGGYGSAVPPDEDAPAAYEPAPEEDQGARLDLTDEAGAEPAQEIAPAIVAEDEDGDADAAPAYDDPSAPPADEAGAHGGEHGSDGDGDPEPAGVGVGRPRGASELSAQGSVDQPHGAGAGPMPDRGDDAHAQGDDADKDEADQRSLRELFWGED